MDSSADCHDLAFGPFRLDAADERLIGPAGPLPLGNKAWRVLCELVAARGRLVTKDRLFETAWDGAAVSESTLTTAIKELRRALGDDPHAPSYIESVYGRGYRFVAEVAEVAAVTAAAGARPVAISASHTIPITGAGASRLRLDRRTALIGAGAAAAAGGAGLAAFLYDRDRIRTATADLAAPGSIAVLPFANLSGDAGQDYFSDGMAEELRTRLSRVPGLLIAARTSSASFKGTTADIATIGERLRVAFVMDGSVRRSGDRLRIAAQLVDAGSGFERWSQTYDRALADIFAIQSDIAEAVTRAVQGRLLGADAAAVSRGGTANPAAYDAYAKGRALFDLSGGEDTYRTALALFDRAIGLDPRYAAAHAARARTLAALANQFEPAERLRATYDAGLAAARRAAALDPTLDDAQSAVGYLLVNGHLDFAGARAPYAESVRLGGGNPDVLIRYGQFFVHDGRAATGLAALAKATRLDPLNPRAFKAYGLALYAARRYAEALGPLHQALALNPGLFAGHGPIGDVRLAQGDLAGARAEYRAEPQTFLRETGLAIVAAKLGNRPEAERALAALVADGGDSVAYQRAQVLSQWGDRAGAIRLLETALRVGDSGLIYIRTDPLLDPLRGEPGFKQLLARLTLDR